MGHRGPRFGVIRHDRAITDDIIDSDTTSTQPVGQLVPAAVAAREEHRPRHTGRQQSGGKRRGSADATDLFCKRHAHSRATE
jgi:hypothetical protein